MPGAGDIIILNNGDRSGSSGDSSSVVEITPPIDSADNYYIHADSAFGPTTPTWAYSNGRSFYSQHLGGAYRLANGNTLAILGTNGVFDEISPSGQIIWTRNAGGQLGHPVKYPRDFTGLAENPKSQQLSRLVSLVPNPFVTAATVRYVIPARSRVALRVIDATGRVVQRLTDCTQDAGSYAATFAPGQRLAAGVYFVRLEATSVSSAQRQVVTRVLVKEH